METVSFRTKRNISDLILELENGQLVTFLLDSPSSNRQSRLVSLAVELSVACNVEVDLEVQLNLGRRPKRADFVFRYQDTLVVGGIASKKNLISEVARVSISVDATRSEVSRLNKEFTVIGFVLEFSNSDKLTKAQTMRYSEKEIYYGSVDKLKGFLDL
jgi:hypothetical protein